MAFWSQLWNIVKLMIIIVLAIRVFMIATVAVDYALVYLADKIARPRKQMDKHYKGRLRKVVVVQPLREEVQ